ncbi:MAG: DNA replication/repair protein RecF [FCB group bacterium]|nr:DNA replication/repair protein RecF [FCB group bacterium]
MYLKSIKISNFRNFTSLRTDFYPRTNVFFGQNGSGKTNLLEAIFVLCLGRSHRSASDAIIINQDANFYRIEGEIVKKSEGVQSLSVAFEKGGRKKITLNKVPLKVAELYKNFSAVIVNPEDSNIISGPPSVRRTFIDIYLAQYSQDYLRTLVDYQKILAQKNAALKKEIDPTPFSELLIEYGVSIMIKRIEFLEEIKDATSGYYHQISGGDDLCFQYKPSVNFNEGMVSKNDIKEAFESCLAKNREREKIVKTSLVGPHRDELYFSINNLPAREFGSQGEWRTAALSLKMAVYHLLRRKRKLNPLLLLDEIFAELDQKRAESLMQSFDNLGQLFLTTAVKPPEFLKRDSRNYQIEKGKIIDII